MGWGGRFGVREYNNERESERKREQCLVGSGELRLMDCGGVPMAYFKILKKKYVKITQRQMCEWEVRAITGPR